MRSSSTLALVLSGAACVAACQPSRPADAYTPPDAASSTYDNSQYNGGAVDDAGSPPPDDTNDPPDTGEGGDTGDTNTGTPDSGGPPADPNDPDQILGAYLMRVDAYKMATATSSVPGASVTVSNRVSNLIFTVISKNDDGTYTSTEQLCAQSYWGSCTGSCRDWTTTVYNGVTQAIQKNVLPVDRKLTITGGKLVADPTTVALGFNDDGASLPTTKTDSRVWNLGGDLWAVDTHLGATLVAGAITQPLDCFVDSVQRYTSSFSGQLDFAAHGGQALTAKPMLANTDDVKIQAIYVHGNPSDYCNADSLNNDTTAGDGISVVRFKRIANADNALSCPVDSTGNITEAAFNRLFPVTEGAWPSQGDLM